MKPSHLKKDSNPSRQKKHDEKKHEMKEQFNASNLMNIPEGSILLNETVYKSLVTNLDKLGLGFHLKDVDVTSLIMVANTMEAIFESERKIKEIGLFQKVMTREGFEKWMATPFNQTRSTNLNNLQTQLKSLQLDPQSRQLLTDSILNDVNMISDEIDEEDDVMAAIMDRLN